MILLTFLIGVASAHPCDSAFWKGKDAHVRCIIDQWNKHDDPLGLRKTPRYTELTPSMGYSSRPLLIMTPYHAQLWEAQRLKNSDLAINVRIFKGFYFVTNP